MSIPEFQKAWVAVRRGPPAKALSLETKWPVSKTLKPGQVLVKVHAAALNPIGYKLMKLLPNFIAGRPHVAEYDFAGTIADENDTTYKKGDEVYGWLETEYQMSSAQGTLAEYVIVPSASLIARPPNISVIQAAGITLTAHTALTALEEAGVEEGQTVLINGGSTSVGGFAIQLAKIKGAKVVAVASGRNEGYVRGLGADEFIDYTKVGPLHKHLAANPPPVKYNAIIETVGMFDTSLYTQSKAYLAPNGAYVSAGPQPALNWSLPVNFLRLISVFLPSFLTGNKASFHITNVQNKRDSIVLLQKYLELGKLKPLVDSVYNFEDALKAYDRLMSSRATGKVVVKIDNSLPDA